MNDLRDQDGPWSGGCVPAWVATVAQTNLQLYNQLIDARWEEHDLERLARAYVLARRVTTGRYRPTGKPFLAHQIGSASIAAHLGLRPDAVIAMLLHGTSEGALRAAARPRHDRGTAQTTLDELVGEQVRRALERYRSLRWDASDAAQLLERADEVDTEERDVVLMRLANELEDLLDRAILYSEKQADGRNNDVPIVTTVALAERLKRPELAAAIRAAASTTAVAPSALRASAQRSYSDVVASPPVVIRALRYGRRWISRRSRSR